MVNQKFSETQANPSVTIEFQRHTDCFDYRGGVYYEFHPQGQTNNCFYYLEVLRRSRGCFRGKRLGLWRSDQRILHHRNRKGKNKVLTADIIRNRVGSSPERVTE